MTTTLNETKFRFCPACGGPVSIYEEHDDIIDALRCDACRSIWWQNSKPGAGAFIINSKQQILLTRRAIEPYKDMWDIPGGFLKNGEDPRTGLKREIEEELAIEVTIEPVVSLTIDRYGDDGDFTLNLFFLAHPLSEDFKPGDDVASCRWFDLWDLPDDIAFESFRNAIEEYRDFTYKKTRRTTIAARRK